MGKIDHETIVIDLPNGEQKGEPYRNINPKGKVPFLEDGDY